MTWAEFKRAVENAGVTDGDVVGWIDISGDYMPRRVEDISISVDTLKDGTREFSVC